jgi:hypothetical protein
LHNRAGLALRMAARGAEAVKRSSGTKLI